MKDCQDEFVCIDCETTGLDVEKDRVIEVAVIRFNMNEVVESFETLVNPEMLIPEESIKIHHITQDMVEGKPKMRQVLPEVAKFFKDSPYIVGHGVNFDLDIVNRYSIGEPCIRYKQQQVIDTLRLARLYGQSPTNSLESLSKHFNVQGQGAHRAMADVQVNIEVFKHLTRSFKSTKDVLKALEKPIFLPNMPLGKHKGRPMREVPLDYLKWASRQDFDRDLLYSIRQEIKRRQKGQSFGQSANPFSSL